MNDADEKPRQRDPLQDHDRWNNEHLMLFYDETEELANIDEEPETYPIEVILDSGACDHVAARRELPGYEVKPSAGSRAGKKYTGASGHTILNEGEIDVVMHAPGSGKKMTQVDTTFQIANINRPLLSVSKICSSGNLDVVCRQNGALILDKTHKVLAGFEKKNGIYVATMRVQNPRKAGFQGPAHR